MTILILLLVAVIICFGFVLFFGAPYLPTLSPQVKTALDMADLQPGDTLLELGCGDGKVLVAAAERGWNAVGYELNPIIACIAWLRTRRYKGRVRVVCGNFWNKKWPESQAIFVFLLDRYMARLDKKVIQYPAKPVKVISFAFQIPDKKALREDAGLYLYEYK